MAGEQSIAIGNVPLESFLLFLFTFILTLLLGNLAYLAMRWLFDGKLPKRHSKLLARFTHYTVIALGLYLGIRHVLGEDYTAFAASLGILGIAVAFSSQQIIQNFMAGLLIALERSIQLEDWIGVGGWPETNVSKVTDLTLTRMILRTVDGRMVYLPNAELFSSKIVNYTKSGFIEVPVQLTVPYSVDWERLKRIVLDVANEDRRILPNLPEEEKTIMTRLLELYRLKGLYDRDVTESSFEPRLLISEISGAHLTLSLRIWIREINKKDEIVSDYLESLWKRLRDEHIALG